MDALPELRALLAIHSGETTAGSGHGAADLV
jgi:hypothetical protein